MNPATKRQRGTTEGLGARNGQILAILSYEARRGILTANATTPYYLGFADLSSGPLVLEMPARGVQGAINDSWQNAIPDTEKPGKHLVVVPGRGNVVNLMDALRKSLGSAAAPAGRSAKKPAASVRPEPKKGIGLVKSAAKPVTKRKSA